MVIFAGTADKIFFQHSIIIILSQLTELMLKTIRIVAAVMCLFISGCSTRIDSEASIQEESGMVDKSKETLEAKATRVPRPVRLMRRRRRHRRRVKKLEPSEGSEEDSINILLHEESSTVAPLIASTSTPVDAFTHEEIGFSTTDSMSVERREFSSVKRVMTYAPTREVATMSPIPTRSPEEEVIGIAIQIMMRLLEEYLRRIHINGGTIHPDWELIRGLNLSSEDYAYIAEKMRLNLLGGSAIGPSCEFAQLLSLSEMPDSAEKKRAKRTFSSSIRDDSLCPSTVQFRIMTEKLESNKSHKLEIQDKANSMYSLFSSIITAKLKSMTVMNQEFKLRRWLANIIREVR